MIDQQTYLATLPSRSLFYADPWQNLCNKVAGLNDSLFQQLLSESLRKDPSSRWRVAHVAKSQLLCDILALPEGSEDLAELRQKPPTHYRTPDIRQAPGSRSLSISNARPHFRWMTVLTVRFSQWGLRLATFVHAVQPCCLLSVDETHLNAVKEEEKRGL